MNNARRFTGAHFLYVGLHRLSPCADHLPPSTFQAPIISGHSKPLNLLPELLLIAP